MDDKRGLIRWGITSSWDYLRREQGRGRRWHTGETGSEKKHQDEKTVTGNVKNFRLCTWPMAKKNIKNEAESEFSSATARSNTTISGGGGEAFGEAGI